MLRRLSILLAITALASCEAITVITAKNHKPEIQTPESIRYFAKKHGFDGYPIIRVDSSIFSFDADILLKFNMYNKQGNYLSLDDQIS